MADTSTYVKLDRNLLNWRWWKNRNTLQVFLWLLCRANIVDHDFEGETIHRGEVATSLGSIGNACGLTIMQVRTTIQHLKLTGEITSRKTPHYQVITIVNYNRYQDNITGKKAVNQQANNKQITSKQQQYKNDKNEKNGKNNSGRSAPSSPSGETQGRKQMPERNDGTVTDIPEMYRSQFSSYADYWDWRNQ